MEKVLVLLSSYNGEKYIKEQIESIMNQENVLVECIIRDDGSSDNSVKIIDETIKNDNRFRLIVGENLGFQKSFFELLKIKNDYKYYAFADQDDVWLPNKLSKAIEKLKEIEEENIPCVYFSNLMQVDSELNEIGLRYIKELQVDSFEENLTHNYAYGCTMVFNKFSKELACRCFPKGKLNHDAWIMLVCAACGKIYYDKNSYILYRRHGNNVSEKISFWALVKKQTKWLFGKENGYIPAGELLDNYSEYMDEDTTSILMIFRDYKTNINAKIKLLKNRNIRRETMRGTLFLKMKFLISRIDTN